MSAGWSVVGLTRSFLFAGAVGALELFALLFDVLREGGGELGSVAWRRGGEGLTPSSAFWPAYLRTKIQTLSVSLSAGTHTPSPPP